MGKPKGTQLAPPRFPSDGRLSPTWVRGFRSHLASHLDETEAARVFDAVEHWLTYWLPSTDFEGNVAALENELHAKLRRVLKLARALHAELSTDPLLVDKYGDIWPHGIEFTGLDSRLRWLISVAEADAAKPTRGRGAPRLEWRDELVSLVYAHYPPAKRTVALFSDFEDTVEMVLRYLGVELRDLHKQIVRTLERGSEPPFIVHDGPGT